MQISDVISPLNPQTNHKNSRINRVSYFMPQQFLIESNKSQEMTDDGYKWNEIGYRRFDGNGERIMPDYIVYFSEGNIAQNDTVWQNSITASEQFKIPIVIVNKKKINEYNSTHKATEFLLKQKIFINNNELINANGKLNRLLNSFSIPNNIFQSDEWEMIKEKYDYDELEPERQQIVEQQFREMIYKRRMNKIGDDDNLFDDVPIDRETTENVERSGKRMM